MMMIDFSVRCFGVGDGNPCPDRRHSSFLYAFGPASLLIDCGEPLTSTFKAARMNWHAFNRILLSHLHFDHIGGFFMFIQGLWLEKRRQEVRVHAPEEGIRPIRELLRAACLFDELLPFRLAFEPLRSEESFDVNGIRVTPWLNTHLNGFKRAFEKVHPGRFESFSFVMENDGLRVAHSADLGSVTDLEPLLREPLDLLVCELAHFTLEEVCESLRDKPIRSVAFIHLSERYWRDLRRTIQRASSLLPGMPLVFPHDGEVIRLRPPVDQA